MAPHSTVRGLGGHCITESKVSWLRSMVFDGADLKDVVRGVAVMSNLSYSRQRVGGWGSWLLPADLGQGGMSSESQAPPLRVDHSVFVKCCLLWLVN
jgi:hypothetical protein